MAQEAISATHQITETPSKMKGHKFILIDRAITIEKFVEYIALFSDKTIHNIFSPTGENQLKMNQLMNHQQMRNIHKKYIFSLKNPYYDWNIIFFQQGEGEIQLNEHCFQIGIPD